MTFFTALPEEFATVKVLLEDSCLFPQNSTKDSTKAGERYYTGCIKSNDGGWSA